MVSVSRLEVVFSKSNVCFVGVIVAPGDGGWVDDRRLEVVSLEQACVLLSAVACCLSFVWSAGTLVCLDEFKMHLLWLSRICFVLFMQL